MKYISAIDGLRTLAIALVILFHLKVPGFALGWAGVPLFFAISGFLITGILIKQKNEMSGFIAFYQNFVRRRAFRIFPLYFACLAFAVAASWLFSESFPHKWSYWIYLQNYTLGITQFKDSYLMGHTWSLAVEEQFYLLWPIIVWVCSRRVLRSVCWLLIFAGIISRWAIVTETGNSLLALTALSSCTDVLAMGALLSLSIADGAAIKQRVHLLIFLAGAMFLTIAVPYENYWTPSLYTPTTFGPFIFSAIGVCSVSAIGIALSNNIFSKILSSPVMTYLGRISYGIYMFHAFFLIKMHWIYKEHPGILGYITWCIVVAGGSIAVASLSYRFFETRFLTFKEKATFKVIL